MFKDAYCHPLPGISYIKESIIGPGGDYDGYYTWFETTCNCLELCQDNCYCTNRYGINYQDGLMTPEKLNNVSSIYECSPFCACGYGCPNKVVQGGPNPYLEIKEAGNKGLGLFTSKTLKAGTFIAEYAGEIISSAIAEQRYKDNKYILIMREDYSGNIVKTCYDAYTHGNIARYINHSCSPNCIVMPVRTGCLIPKPGIFAAKDISANEEITYSYMPETSSLSSTICLCKSTNCKGYLPSNNNSF